MYEFSFSRIIETLILSVFLFFAVQHIVFTALRFFRLRSKLHRMQPSLRGLTVVSRERMCEMLQTVITALVLEVVIRSDHQRDDHRVRELIERFPAPVVDEHDQWDDNYVRLMEDFIDSSAPEHIRKKVELINALLRQAATVPRDPDFSSVDRNTVLEKSMIAYGEALSQLCHVSRGDLWLHSMQLLSGYTYKK